ncbi:MAG: Dyp-type peroxidase [Rhizobacter sp.]|nr:Dyp-type peroxidase [Rhizobacter sp.]
MTTTKMSTQLAGIANLALLAPIKPGFVEGYETLTYAKRLESLLKTLDAIRHATREAALEPSLFPDAVGRVGLLHSFRYAIVPPDVGSAGEIPPEPGDPRPGIYRLSLNVTFDGGWEPYMRVIYGPLGPLLDAIFCNCAGYPLSRSNSFVDYMRWVRSCEVPGGLYYTDSAMTVGDGLYLQRTEALYRNTSRTVVAQQAHLAVEQPANTTAGLAKFGAASKKKQRETIKSSFRALKALYDLKVFYPHNTARDDLSILLFAKSVMPEFIAVITPQLGNPTSPFKAVLDLYREPIEWVRSPVSPAKPKKNTPRQLTGVQAGIVSRYVPDITHGCLVLLKVTDAELARKFLAGRAKKWVNFDGEAPVGDIRCNLAFTLQGLQALEVPASKLAQFPQEFIEGMEARAGLLGDVRGNHPSEWKRPKLDKSKLDVELRSVHVVVQLRLADPGNADHAFNPKFQPTLDSLQKNSGLRMLSCEPMRSYPETLNGENLTRDGFGFRDGISQPELTPSGNSHPFDKVEPGDLFLGHANGKGDGPYPPDKDPLLDNGSFLVLRKIRQRVDHLHKVVKKSTPGFDKLAPLGKAKAVETILTPLVGRQANGAPLVTLPAGHGLNNFDYKADATGQQCPFQSHVRRTNPRTGPGVPRILRRGMSYGPRSPDPKVERGTYFMAYCASIAEQFEIVQRWMTGGNSSGLLSTHSDPLLGVPQSGEKRKFHYLDASGKAAVIDLGDKPLTELQWGLYLFVPSKQALSALVAPTQRPQRVPQVGGGRETSPKPDPFDTWKRLLEDPEERDKTYRHLRQGHPTPPTTTTPYGTVVASEAEALEVLQDSGGKHSVCGYGRRMEESIGLGYLGLDRGPAYAAQAGVNAILASVSAEQAFNETVAITTLVIGAVRKAALQALPNSPEIPLNFVELSERVLGLLCARWFGLPDANQAFMQRGSPATPGSKAVCPQDFFSVARFLFWPHPSETEEQDGQAHGKRVLTAVKKFMAAARQNPGLLPPLSKQIAAHLAPLRDQDRFIVERTLAGVMLGFPPTVHQNFLRLIRGWVERKGTQAQVSLWDLQADLVAAGSPIGYEETAAVLMSPLFEQMRRDPAPEMIWREKRGATTQGGKEPDKTVVWLAGIMRDPKAHNSMMFGGMYKTSPGQDFQGFETAHGCPGTGMAIGVLLGMVSSILRAGTLRSTPSWTVAALVVKPG